MIKRAQVRGSRVLSVLLAAAAVTGTVAGCSGESGKPAALPASASPVSVAVPGDVTLNGPVTLDAESVRQYGREQMQQAAADMISLATHQGVDERLLDTRKPPTVEQVRKIVGPWLTDYTEKRLVNTATAVLDKRDRRQKPGLDVLTSIKVSAPGMYDFRSGGLMTVHKTVSDVTVSMPNRGEGVPPLVAFTFTGDWRMQDKTGKPVLAPFSKTLKFFVTRNVRTQKPTWVVDLWDGSVVQEQPKDDPNP